jgi:4'-phosphopantetheinyl transferase
LEWKKSPATLRLAAGGVHVWRASLSLDVDELAHAWELLAPAERRRAERMPFPLHRARFVAGRAALRILLGRYLGIAPGEVPLIAEPGGRPAVDPTVAVPLRFSVAHSDRLALFAFADRQVGVDVERLRREVAFERLAARFFAPAEAAALAALPQSVVPAAFFACWTRKEAVFKAWGGASGLVPALKRFAVSVSPREQRLAITFFDDEPRRTPWSLAALDPAPGYAAALAVAGPASPTCFVFDWSG